MLLPRGAKPGNLPPPAKRGQSPFERSSLRAVPANGDCPLFPHCRFPPDTHAGSDLRSPTARRPWVHAARSPALELACGLPALPGYAAPTGLSQAARDARAAQPQSAIFDLPQIATQPNTVGPNRAARRIWAGCPTTTARCFRPRLADRTPFSPRPRRRCETRSSRHRNSRSRH